MGSFTCCNNTSQSHRDALATWTLQRLTCWWVAPVRWSTWGTNNQTMSCAFKKSVDGWLRCTGMRRRAPCGGVSSGL